MGVGVFNKSHLNIDVLVRLLPKRIQPWFALFSNIIVMIFLGAVFRFSIPFAQANADQVTPYLLLPMAWIYYVIPITVTFMLIFLLIDTVKLLRSMAMTQSVDGR